MAVKLPSVTDPLDLLRIQTNLKKAVYAADTLPELADSLAQACLAFPSLDGTWIWSRKSSADQLKLESSAGFDQQVWLMLSRMDYTDPVVSHLQVGHEVVNEWDKVWGEKSQAFYDAGLNQVGVLPMELADGQMVVLGFASRQDQEFDLYLLNALRLVVLDFGERLQMLNLKTRLLGAKQNFEQIITSLDGYLFVVDQKGTILHSNISEYLPDTGHRNIDTVLPEGTKLLRQGCDSLEAISSKEKRNQKHCRLKMENGRLLPVDVKIRKMHWNGRKACLITCRDITQQLVIEKERNRLETAIEQTADSIIITDSAGIIQYVNPGFTRMTGYSAADVLGENPNILKSDRHDEEFYRQMWHTILRGETWQGRLANRTKAGKEFWEMATISPVHDTNGVITHFVGVKRDITSEMKLEERLRQSQKFEAIGALTGGIAHDFNNILFSLLGNSQLALDDIPENHPAHLPLTEIVKAGERGSALVAKMLAYGRQSDNPRAIKSLSPIVIEIMELVRASLPKTIAIKLDLADDCPDVLLDENQIHQTVLNLCTNAADAMAGESGVLTLSLQPTTVHPDTPESIKGLAPGEYSKLTVSDTGSGMESSVVSQIFKPYFTTKKLNEGTGLGLASVQGIVINHEAKIFVDSTPGQGSTFTLFFPAAKSADSVKEKDLPQEKSVQDLGRVMVVDDEPMLANLLKRGLENAGYDVTDFTNPLEALEAFKIAPHNYDYVVADQNMPQITGINLATQLSSLRPDLPIVLSTGDSSVIDDQELEDAGISQLVSKPLLISDLVKLLGRVKKPVSSIIGE